MKESGDRLAEPGDLRHREQTLNWFRKYFNNMDYESEESPLDVQLPRTTEDRTAEMEEAMNKMHLTFGKEVSKLHKTLEEMHASHRAEMETVQNNIGLGQVGQGRGNSYLGMTPENENLPPFQCQKSKIASRARKCI